MCNQHGGASLKGVLARARTRSGRVWKKTYLGAQNDASLAAFAALARLSALKHHPLTHFNSIPDALLCAPQRVAAAADSSVERACPLLRTCVNPPAPGSRFYSS